MAGNFQGQMNMPGQMMDQQRQQQRPQGNPVAGQMQQMIYNALHQHTGPLEGWRAQVLVQERIALIMNIIGNLRLISHGPNAPNIEKMIEIGVKFEREIFEKSVDKESYKQESALKMQQLLERRNRNQPNMQQSINDQARMQAQAQQAAAQQQQMMMNQNGGQGQGQGQVPMQQGFHQLQHQMTATPIPGQNPQMGMGMPNQGMPQNMTPNQQQQFQMAMQAQQQAQNGPQRPNMGLNAAAEAQVNAMVEKIMTRTSEEEKNNLRNQLRSRMDPTTANNYAANNIDPLRLYYKQQATANYRRQMAQNQVQQGQQPQRMISEQQGQNIQATAPPMQQQRSTNPSPMNAQTQPTTSAPGNPDFFAGSMIDQQQQGLMAEQAGQMVVPMSNAQRNATPQPGMAAQMNMNNQQAGANANAQRQQIFNAQQARLQQQQQQQSQQAARVNAQNKAQMGLQGQPGGISGPMPPLRSPAMETLNTPLRTPGPMNQAELPQGIPNPPFGQPQDPRFPQGYPRTPQQQMVLNTMPPELQQKMAAIPPERIEQVLGQYNQRRQAAAAAAAAQQAGRPPGAMPNGQMRPGQPMPQAQFNPQNAINQFLMANPGAQPPPQLMNGMTQAQQMMLRQQIARNSNPNPLQQRPPGQIGAIDPRAMQQMDGMDIPPAIITHPHMPRGIPQELKKWGQVKNWVQHSSQGLPPDSLAIVTNLQRMHYSTIMRSRLNGGQGPPGGVVPAGVPSVLPPGMAPVANMGNPMQMPNMNMPQGGLPQVTPQDIHNIRNGNPNMAGATDDQIRNLIMKNRMQQYQQQTMRQNHLMQQQQHMAMAQMNGQQPRPGMPPGQAQPGGQNIPGQMALQKPQPAPEPVVPTPAPSRANRPAQAGRGNPPNSSPAEPPKNNLKRQSSEDVVEVPNPNAASQRTPQQNPIQKPGIPQQQMRANMSPEDLAKLPPEQQKKYEVAMMMYKLKQLATEEGQKAQTYPDVPMDANSKTRIINGLKSLLNPMNGMARSMSKWYQSTRDDNRARLFYRLQFRIKRQFKDEKFIEVKETLSMSLNDLEQGKQVLASMVEDLKTMAAPDMKKTNSSQAHPSPAANTQTAQALPPTPLNAANLQQQQQQLNKMHQRSASRGGQPPAAPTSTHAPFQFGAVSPHGAGAPVYNGNAHTVTQKDLKIPPRKRQKGPDGTPSGLGTPGSNASPLLSKALSPEMKRQSTVEKPPAKPLLCCSEPDCERHNTGFETQEALDRHRQEEHVRPLADPTKYVQENLAAVLGLDAEGQTKANGGEKMIKADSKQGQTPIKAGTPMSRQDSMMRAPSSTGGKPMQKPDQTKPQSQAVAPMESSWSMATIDPQDLFSTFVNYDSAAGGSISDMNVYRSITPNESPESNSTTTTDVSDISDGVNLDISLDLSFDETWMPFGASELDALGGASTSLDNFDFGNDDMTIPLAEDEAMVNYSTWDDTKQDFGKPFEFESDLFSMGY